MQPKIKPRDLFNLRSEDFNDWAKKTFYFQYETNQTYKNYCDLINFKRKANLSIETLPFIPISLFKTHCIKSGSFMAEAIFQSSGTGGERRSRHHVKNLSLYEMSFSGNFKLNYGYPSDYCILALLPSYMEQKNSSLIYMVDQLMEKSEHPKSGYFLYEHQKLRDQINQLMDAGQKTILIGVSFALLDFAKKFRIQSKPGLLTIIETGGMKGRKKEILREDLHQRLKKCFQGAEVHSEYGMTELLSQAYAKNSGRFYPPPWMKILIRKQDDPFSYCQIGEVGGINIIDLANQDSVAFIQTDDLGRVHQDGSFEVLGRFDRAEARGCNLLIT